MTALPGRVVLASSPALLVCNIGIRQNDTQTLGVRAMKCCTKEINPCIAENADKTLNFVDLDTVDYSGATEITFDVWQNGQGGTNVVSKSLTGGTITLAEDHRFTCNITATDSDAMGPGHHWCEAWVTLSGGEKRLVGAGRFKCENTRKHD
jgi:hypothetical protein